MPLLIGEAPLEAGRSWAAAVLLIGCSFNPTPARLQEAVLAAEQVGPEIERGAHDGPGVSIRDTGPARYVSKLYEAFQNDRCYDTVVFADRFYREPGSDGYRATMDYVERELKRVGFGEDERLELRVLEHHPDLPSWTPRHARLAMRVPGGAPVVLHEFEKEIDRDRVMLPRNAPSARLSGRVVFELNAIATGDVLVTESPLRRDLVNRASLKGAAAVVSASLGFYNVDPSGEDRHLDAVQYRVLRFVPALPVAQISPNSYARLQEAHLKSHGEVEVDFEAEVEIVDRPVRTLVATVVGGSHPDDAVAIVSHVQEPGACDNATGVAGLLESARVLVGLLRAGKLPWPARSMVFIWGDEMVQSRTWLEETERRAVAALSSDMTGQSREKTGAIALLERVPDPGAVQSLPPDQHTAWGATPVEAASLLPNGLSVVARCAIVDVGQLVGGWTTAEHPWEGGSDHDVFIEQGTPAVLFWHFTDFAYHTSLDRLEHVDPEEMRRSAVAILATGLAVADPKPTDLDRYLECVRVERELRLAACDEADEEELALLWQEWSTGARMWLRAHCLGLSPEGDREER